MTYIPQWLLPPQGKGRIRRVLASRAHRKVRIGERVFPSTVHAAQSLGCSVSHIRVMVCRKKAFYLD